MKADRFALKSFSDGEFFSLSSNSWYLICYHFNYAQCIDEFPLSENV